MVEPFLRLPDRTQSLVRTISDFTVTLAGNVLTVEAEGRKKRYGSERPETQRARVVVRLRNATAVP